MLFVKKLTCVFILKTILLKEAKLETTEQQQVRKRKVLIQSG